MLLKNVVFNKEFKALTGCIPKSKMILLVMSLVMTSPVRADYEIKLDEEKSIKFGGYIKMDIRYVSGEVPYRPFWIADGKTGEDASQTNFNGRESRFNMAFVNGEVTAFMEYDFYGSDGSEAIVNNFDDRLRHAYIKTKNWTVGQTWSVFMPLSAIPEALDLAGPHLAEAQIRQPQVRYTNGGFQISIENPYTTGADHTNDVIPDIAARYVFSGDWGEFGMSGLYKNLDHSGMNETALAYNAYAKILLGEQDDFRIQFNGGEPGRYVAPKLTTDIVDTPEGKKVEETISCYVAFRHFWAEGLRSNIFYGHAETEYTQKERQMWAVNLMQSFTSQLTAGVEVGNYEVTEKDKSSDYLQFSVIYKL